MKNKLSACTLALLISLVSCTNEETLDTALAIGAQTTSSIFINECENRYDDLSNKKTEASNLVFYGLQESKTYFISIRDTKWIEEAEEIGNASLEAAKPTMTKGKCESFINAIISDNGIQKGKNINDYYTNKEA